MTFAELQHIYCGCFSENPDDLAQWRAYADDGRGTAIGFDLDAIVDENGGARLEKRGVEYDPNAHKRIAEDILARRLVAALDDPRASRIVRAHGVCMARHDLIRAGASCKGSEFRAEKEQRLLWASLLDPVPESQFPDPTVFFGDTGLRPQVRTDRGTMIPFTDVQVPTNAVKEIRLGPCFGTGERELSLKMFLRLHGFGVEEDFVVPSRVTYRNEIRCSRAYFRAARWLAAAALAAWRCHGSALLALADEPGDRRRHEICRLRPCRPDGHQGRTTGADSVDRRELWRTPCSPTSRR
jgi:hypothetical protein